jgi:hypothetical protein
VALSLLSLLVYANSFRAGLLIEDPRLRTVSAENVHEILDDAASTSGRR